MLWNNLKWQFIWRVGNVLLRLRGHGESSDQSGESSAIVFGPLVVWSSISHGCAWLTGIDVDGRCLLTAWQ